MNGTESDAPARQYHFTVARQRVKAEMGVFTCLPVGVTQGIQSSAVIANRISKVASHPNIQG